MTAQAAATPTAPSKNRDYLPVILTIVGLVLLAIWLLKWDGGKVALAWDPVFLWLVIFAILTALIMLIGKVSMDRWSGVLINSRYKMSLGRLQIILWTLMVFSAYFTIAMHRLFDPPMAMDAEVLAACQDKLQQKAVTAAECGGSPINITFPDELLAALGISAASFAGSTIVQSSKRNKKAREKSPRLMAAEQREKDAKQAYDKAEKDYIKAMQHKDQQDAALANASVDPKVTALKAQNAQDVSTALKNYQKAKVDLEKAQEDLGKTKEDMEKAQKDLENATKKREEAEAIQRKKEEKSIGLLQKNDAVNEAKFSDMLKGDEIENYNTVDTSKVQMYLLTVVVLIVYAVAIGKTLHDPAVLNDPIGYSFPPFSDSLNGLLAISHGTYIAVKTTDHTQTDQSS